MPPLMLILEQFLQGRTTQFGYEMNHIINKDTFNEVLDSIKELLLALKT